jgi:opacity protein-like surface antigen
MKYGITAALFLAGLAASAGARAQIVDNDSGWYAGGGVGEFDVEIDDFDDVDDTIDDFDDGDTAYKLFAGWRANNWLALELAYINLGSPSDEIFDDTTVEVESDGFAPYVVGTLPIGFFEAFAKAGYYFYDIEVSLDSPFGDVTDDDSGSEFVWSAGLGLNILERVNIRLEYEEFDFDETDDTNALWLTGAFRF